MQTSRSQTSVYNLSKLRATCLLFGAWTTRVLLLLFCCCCSSCCCIICVCVIPKLIIMLGMCWIFRNDCLPTYISSLQVNELQFPVQWKSRPGDSGICYMLLIYCIRVGLVKILIVECSSGDKTDLWFEKRERRYFYFFFFFLFLLLVFSNTAKIP